MLPLHVLAQVALQRVHLIAALTREAAMVRRRRRRMNPADARLVRELLPADVAPELLGAVAALDVLVQRRLQGELLAADVAAEACLLVDAAEVEPQAGLVREPPVARVAFEELVAHVDVRDVATQA
ncbi:unnamed protein product [Sphagnum tenellum]